MFVVLRYILKNVEVRLERNADLHDASSCLEVRKTLRGSEKKLISYVGRSLIMLPYFSSFFFLNLKKERKKEVGD